jgi:NifU-like protein involved in Fe-S cluster formation
VSIISSEVLLESIKGLTIEEAKKIDKEKLLEMVGLNLTTSRVKCATLALTALNAALEEYEKNR